MRIFRISREIRTMLLALLGTLLVTGAMAALAFTVDRMRLEKKHDMLDTAIVQALSRADADATTFAILLERQENNNTSAEAAGVWKSYQRSDLRIVATGNSRYLFFFDTAYEDRNRDEVIRNVATAGELIMPFPEDTLLIRGKDGFIIVPSSYIAGIFDQIEQDTVGFDISLIRSDQPETLLYRKLPQPEGIGAVFPFAVKGVREFQSGQTTFRTRLIYYPEEISIFQGIAVLLTFVLGLIFSITMFVFTCRHVRTERNLYNLERQKDEFVAIASHELKTPLTSIKALNQLLAQRMESENNLLYESYFRKMDSQMRRMENLINDLLDVSRIRSGKLLYTMDAFNLESVVRAVCDDVAAISRTHQVRVEGELRRMVCGDRDRITQVLTNLMINAAKYSPQANLIMVRMRETEREAIVSIQDFGIGIAKEYQKRIFDRFYRVGTAEQKFHGLGIGLFISAEIIRRHGGRIWVKSTRGKGSTFSFSLPLYKKRVV